MKGQSAKLGLPDQIALKWVLLLVSLSICYLIWYYIEYKFIYI